MHFNQKFNVSKEELDRLYRGEWVSIGEIAARFTVSTGTITNWIKRYGIQRGTHRQFFLPKEEVVPMYLEQKLTLKEIGEKYGCNPVTVMHNLHAWGVKMSRTEHDERRIGKNLKANKLPDRYTFVRIPGEGRRKFEHRVIAEGMIGRTVADGEQVHHMNFDKRDNSMDNLAVLPSLSAHRRMHHYMELVGAYLVGLLKKRPDPLGFEKPAFIRGQWVREIDLIGDREPLRPDLDLKLSNQTSAGKALVN